MVRGEKGKGEGTEGKKKINTERKDFKLNENSVNEYMSWCFGERQKIGREGKHRKGKNIT